MPTLLSLSLSFCLHASFLPLASVAVVDALPERHVEGVEGEAEQQVVVQPEPRLPLGSARDVAQSPSQAVSSRPAALPPRVHLGVEAAVVGRLLPLQRRLHLLLL